LVDQAVIALTPIKAAHGIAPEMSE